MKNLKGDFIQGRIALFALGPDGNRIIPALTTEGNYKDVEEIVSFIGWGNLSLDEGGDLIIDLPNELEKAIA